MKYSVQKHNIVSTKFHIYESFISQFFLHVHIKDIKLVKFNSLQNKNYFL